MTELGSNISFASTNVIGLNSASEEKVFRLSLKAKSNTMLHTGDTPHTKRFGKVKHKKIEKNVK